MLVARIMPKTANPYLVRFAEVTAVPKAFTVSMIQDTTAEPSLKQVLFNNFKLMTVAEIDYVCRTLHLNHMTYQNFRKIFVQDEAMMQALKDDLHEFLTDDDRFVRTAFTKFQIFLRNLDAPSTDDSLHSRLCSGGEVNII